MVWWIRLTWSKHLGFFAACSSVQASFHIPTCLLLLEGHCYPVRFWNHVQGSIARQVVQRIQPLKLKSWFHIWDSFWNPSSVLLSWKRNSRDLLQLSQTWCVAMHFLSQLFPLRFLERHKRHLHPHLQHHRQLSQALQGFTS